MRRDLHDALKALDMKYRVPFILFYKGFKYKEIAKRLELPLGTVKSRIYFARKLLMEDLRDLI
jgi:RNA polymerase sigma-70 factor (ECF subfamily)